MRKCSSLFHIAETAGRIVLKSLERHPFAICFTQLLIGLHLHVRTYFYISETIERIMLKVARYHTSFLPD